MDIYMAESFHCSPEVITTLLIGYTSMENKKFKLKKKRVVLIVYQAFLDIM